MHYALKDYGADLKWSVGSLFCHDEMLFGILDLCRRFDIDHPIRWAYGCIPSLMGSGMAISPVHTVHSAISIMNKYLDYGVACRLALTNPHADLKMIADDIPNCELIYTAVMPPISGLVSIAEVRVVKVRKEEASIRIPSTRKDS